MARFLSCLVLLALLLTMSVSSFPLRSRGVLPIGTEDPVAAQWEVFYPSLSLLDWSLQVMSDPELAEAKANPRLVAARAWLPLSQPQMRDMDKDWSPDWSGRQGQDKKRNIVVADDAAFREKSKLLTAMERQKWLNSYMQKLLVVNSQ